MEESLWKAEIKKLFLWNVVSSVWVDVGGAEGTKGLLVVHVCL